MCAQEFQISFDSVLLPQVSIANDQKLYLVPSIVHLVQTHITRGKSEVDSSCVLDIAGLALSPFLLACG